MSTKNTESMGWDYLGDVIVAANAPGVAITLPALGGYRKYALVVSGEVTVTTAAAQTTGLYQDGVGIGIIGPLDVGVSLFAYDAGGPTNVTFSVFATVNGDLNSLPVTNPLSDAGYLRHYPISATNPADGDTLVYDAASGTWVPSPAVLNTISEIGTWNANDAILPTAGPGTLTKRNDEPVIAFTDSADESCFFMSMGPLHLLGTETSFRITIAWAAATAVIGDVYIGFALENQTGLDIDTDNWSVFTSDAFTTAGTAGVITYSTLDITPGAGFEVKPEECYRVRVNRYGTDGLDTLVGDMHLVGVQLKVI